MSRLYAIVLAGGSGTRLWPLSRQSTPKQLHNLSGELTLLQSTVKRLQGRIDPERMIFITSSELVRDIKSQVENYLGSAAGSCMYIGEPFGRNTAPAILLGAHLANTSDPESLILATPADHVIVNEARFHEAVDDSIDAAINGKLITYGIKPTRPDTGYGYIRAGVEHGKVLLVDGFEEKPPLSRAEEFLKRENYLWNSGIFMFSAKAIIAEAKKYIPEVMNEIEKIDTKDLGGLDDAYERIKPVSIDHGIMEKTSQAAVIPVSFGWSDVGSWDSLYDLGEKDKRGNVTSGNVVNVEARDSLISAGDKLLAVAGVNDLIVVQTEDATMICQRGSSQEVKKIVDLLAAEGRSELTEHLTVERPWGKFTVLQEGPGYKVKKLSVIPGGKLSLQRHKKRNENWVVISGTARVTLDEDIKTLQVNESTYINSGTKHRLENPEDTLLEIIEVQTGEYFGEDDIERFDDIYGRVDD